MTVLEAVNEMLESIHEYPVTELDTGGTSMAASAETTLDRFDRRIQREGWLQNTETDIELDRADVTKQDMVIAAGAWTVANKRLISVGAFSRYTYAAGDQLYVSGGTGVTAGWYEIRQKINDNAIQLVESIADTDAADITTTVIGWENAIELPDDIIAADTAENAAPDVTLRAGKLYDRNDNTFSFSTDIERELTRQLAFADLSEDLAAYITTAAAVDFQKSFVGSRSSDKDLREKRHAARAQAYADDAETADHNVLQTPSALRVKGSAGVAQRGR